MLVALHEQHVNINKCFRVTICSGLLIMPCHTGSILLLTGQQHPNKCLTQGCLFGNFPGSDKAKHARFSISGPAHGVWLNKLGHPHSRARIYRTVLCSKRKVDAPVQHIAQRGGNNGVWTNRPSHSLLCWQFSHWMSRLELCSPWLTWLSSSVYMWSNMSCFKKNAKPYHSINMRTVHIDACDLTCICTEQAANAT